jgi:cell wall-associated NlpC family hydrolase
MNLRRRLSRTLIVAASVVLVSPAVFPEAASAGVEDARQEVQRIVDELERLESQADILAEDYAVAEDSKRQLDIEVAEAEQRVADQEAELNSLRGDLSEVAIRSFTGAGADVLGPLFSSPTQYGEGLQRDQYSRVALAVGTTTTDDLDELITSLDEEKKILAAKREQVELLKETIVEKQAQTKELTARYVEARADAEARLGEEIRKEEERRAAEAYAKLQAELAAEQAAASAAAAAAATSSNSGGGGNADTGGGGGGDTSSTNTGGGGDSGGSNAPAPAPAAAPAPAPPSNVPAVSGLAGIAVQAAYSQLGKPYRYATAGPDSYDCSGLTHFAWGQAGVYLPRNSRAQAAATPRVPPAAAQPGDLIFYYSPISHVGIYAGGGQLVHAPNSGTVVKVAGVSWGKVTAVGRPG